jgi:hypothetical protein
MPVNCSYCHTQGHNIRRCNNPNLADDYNELKRYYFDLKRQNLGDDVSKRRFVHRVCAIYAASDLKAIGCRYAGSIARATKKIQADIIWSYIQNVVDLLDEERQFIATDPIPYYARDLEAPEDVTWNIDTSQAPSNFVTPGEIFEVDGISRLDGAGNTYNVNYVPREDEFIPFATRNLNQEFDALSNVKKFKIVPILHLTEETEETADECAICYEATKLKDTVRLNCGHHFCGTCIKSSLNAHNDMYHRAPSCALCRTRMTTFVVKNKDVYNLVAEHVLYKLFYFADF